MAIVKGSYTRSRGAIKAHLRYITHRPNLDGKRASRVLFGQEGILDKQQAYQLIDAAEPGTVFFRMVISPDPKREDTGRDLDLQTITRKTMFALEERLQRKVKFIATEHNDHSTNRHIHAIVMVRLAKGERLSASDYKLLREAATGSAYLQRRALDLVEARAPNQNQLNRAFPRSTPLNPLMANSGGRAVGGGGVSSKPFRLTCPDCGITQIMYTLKSGIHWCPACHLKLNQNREQVKQLQLE
jgi:ribosomal protein S27E